MLCRVPLDVPVESGERMDEKAADENLVELFQQWLTAFEAVQAATCEEEAVAQREVLADVECAHRGDAIARGCVASW